MSKTILTTRGDITIRPAVLKDAASLREIRLTALANHPVAFAADYAMTKAEPVDIWIHLIQDYNATGKGVINIALADDEIIGMAGLVREKSPKTEHSGFLWGVYVMESWRGEGLADALLMDCSDWGQAHGLSVVKLGVTTTNVPAIRCYDRCGFTIYGIEPKVIHYNDSYYDEFLMVKFI